MGGLDVSLDGLANQTLPYEDYEVLLCDVHYERRKEHVKRYIKEKMYKIPLVHFAPSRTTYPVDSGSMHRNSAIAMAEGEISIFLCDYTFVFADWLQRHWKTYEDSGKKATAMAPHRYHVHPEIKQDWENEPISIFTREFHPEMLGQLALTPEGSQDPKLILPAGGIPSNYFHMKNEAMRTDILLSINGCDEGYDVDGGHCYSDTDLGLRLQQAGNQFVHDPVNIAEIIQIRDFYPFCQRNRTPTDDYAYYKQVEPGIMAGHYWANNNGLDLSKLREEMLEIKKKNGNNN